MARPGYLRVTRLRISIDTALLVIWFPLFSGVSAGMDLYLGWTQHVRRSHSVEPSRTGLGSAFFHSFKGRDFAISTTNGIE